jgi:hypothetical protein
MRYLRQAISKGGAGCSGVSLYILGSAAVADRMLAGARKRVRQMEEGAESPIQYGAAQIATSRTNPDAQAEGFRDVFDLIMSDSDHSRQPVFLGLVGKALSDDQRKILLDGMAKEYAGCDGWLAYIDRECDD